MKFKDKLRWYKAELGVRINGISLMVDPVNACTFKCPSCPAGNMASRPGGKLPLERFVRILDVIENQNKIRNVLLYAFSEPFLHPQLPDMVAEVKRRGLPVMISTNLSRPENIERVFAAGLDELRISFSGFENGQYFHRGRSMSQFKEACRRVSRLIPKYNTRVGLIFHVYATNKHELPVVEEFAAKHGFELIRETAFFIPNEKIVYRWYTEEDLELIQHLTKHPEDHARELERDEICFYQQKQIVVDALERVFLCRSVYDVSLIVGGIMHPNLKEIRRRMAIHEFCKKCKDARLNVYKP